MLRQLPPIQDLGGLLNPYVPPTLATTITFTLCSTLIPAISSRLERVLHATFTCRVLLSLRDEISRRRGGVFTSLGTPPLVFSEGIQFKPSRGMA
jgi:hypothetical protein